MDLSAMSSAGGFGGDPYLAPALLLACALLASLFASLRGRHAEGLGRRLRFVHVIVAIVAVLISASLVAERSRVFWGLSLDERGESLVLERLGPLENHRVALTEIVRVTEIATVERNWAGTRARVEFQVATSSGEVHTSAPHYHRSDATRTRGLLANASHARYERFNGGTSANALH